MVISQTAAQFGTGNWFDGRTALVNILVIMPYQHNLSKTLLTLNSLAPGGFEQNFR